MRNKLSKNLPRCTSQRGLWEAMFLKLNSKQFHSVCFLPRYADKFETLLANHESSKRIKQWCEYGLQLPSVVYEKEFSPWAHED